MSTKEQKETYDDDELNLNYLTVPSCIAHVKAGSTLCTNDKILILQDGATTIEVRLPPKFEAKRVPWRDGLLRDIAWCSELGVFVFLTQKTLFTFNPKSLVALPTTTINTDIQLTMTSYNKIKPFDDKNSFWRCAVVGKTVFISYSGFGTIIDEYLLKSSSCELVNRWTPPTTCADHEGIWCIRYHPSANQLGMSIMDGQTNQWHFEIRDRNNLSRIWQTVLPVAHGDCEISPLPNGHWLTINSCGIRLIHIAHQKLKAAVEYERELKNAIIMGKEYFIVRTKNTIEVHLVPKKRDH